MIKNIKKNYFYDIDESSRLLDKQVDRKDKFKKLIRDLEKE